MNRYVQYKKEVGRISKERDVDIGVACAMLRAEKGWTFEATEGVDKEITEFTSMVHDMSPEEVKKFFAE